MNTKTDDSQPVDLPSQPAPGTAISENAADSAFAPLFELFSKPTKSSQKAFRTYELTFENGEPMFTLSAVDRIIEEAFEGIFDQA
ncbi:hypothetical protein [Bradyrhizobium sp. 17]|uniref:hypothetical protein n=1 Tax=Bradyrhizobium sp. 17 TaxID=2782649 RepID=UPI001FFB9CEE|nr:hypothetical protein [Bradyrhizobium sp. 17]MCK1518860.1 hypothetical protein [Bradyrhizobium sp. 17]